MQLRAVTLQMLTHRRADDGELRHKQPALAGSSLLLARARPTSGRRWSDVADVERRARASGSRLQDARAPTRARQPTRSRVEVERDSLAPHGDFDARRATAQPQGSLRSC